MYISILQLFIYKANKTFFYMLVWLNIFKLKFEKSKIINWNIC